MKKRLLGNSDMNLSLIGFGAWAIGGEWTWGWGVQDDNDSIAAIHRALDRGINWIDTAPVYGLGRSERVVGKAIKERRDKPYVFTKCSMVWDQRSKVSNSLKRESIRAEVEASLSRLGVDVIDLYQIHWPVPEQQIEEGWETLAELKREGLVRNIGVSNFSVEQMERAQKITTITSLQPPYNLIRRDIEKGILPYCQEKGIGVICYSTMASGLLSGGMSRERLEKMDPSDWRKTKNDLFQEPALSRCLKLQDLLREIGSQYGRTAGETAIAWTLRNPAITAAIVGMRRPEQVEGVFRAGEMNLSDTDIKKIEAFFHQREG
ncbi:MAG: aldo/keto reductase [Deltaproteobacteria bacterium]|nr:aldo/keto reductase [Deltaproteobacteria bacterium]